jgi:hypothetical protein
MGTCLNVCTSLADLKPAHEVLTPIFSLLAAGKSDRNEVQSFIRLRNDIHHGRATATIADADRLDTRLREFAQRAVNSWRAKVSVPVTMSFDGERYIVELLTFIGSEKPVPDVAMLSQPMVTGRAVLLYGPDYSRSISLEPWLVARSLGRGSPIRLFQTDGVSSAGSPTPTDQVRYIPADGLDADVSPRAATWEILSGWAGS